MMRTRRATTQPAPADAGGSGGSWISKTPGVCGGDACLRGTRIPVWLLVEQRRLGETDPGILEAHPALSSADLQLAWSYYATFPDEIEQSIRENSEA
jgi:uncharacterized protein (DUF433 family)